MVKPKEFLQSFWYLGGNRFHGQQTLYYFMLLNRRFLTWIGYIMIRRPYLFGTQASFSISRHLVDSPEFSISSLSHSSSIVTLVFPYFYTINIETQNFPFDIVPIPLLCVTYRYRDNRDTIQLFSHRVTILVDNYLNIIIKLKRAV